MLGKEGFLRVLFLGWLLLLFSPSGAWGVGLPQFNLDASDVVAKPLRQQEVVPKYERKKLQRVEHPVIREILVEGLFFGSKEEALNQVFSRVGEPVVEEKLQADAKAIYALGYFSDVSLKLVPIANGTRVIFQVKENPVLSEVVLEGVAVFNPSDVLSQLKSKPGELLNYKQVQEDVQKINALYRDQGYALARVAGVSSDPALGILKLEVVEGVIETIAFEGNDVTKPYVLQREMDLKPGQALNEKILSQDLRRIFNLGFFADVNPRFEPAKDPNKVTLVVAVEENRNSSINFGGGFGDREGGFGFIDLNVDNLFGTAQGMLLRGQLGQLQSTYQVRYTNPWFWPERLGPRTSFTGRRWFTTGRDIFLSDLNEDSVRDGWDAVFGKKLSDFLSSSFSAGIERVEPTNESTFEAFTSTTIGLSLGYDTRDFWLNPSTGVYYNFGVRQGWVGKDSGNTSFRKYTVDLNQFYPRSASEVLAFHFGVGYGTGDIPISELFFAGGANTVRGYNPDDAHTGTRKVIFNAEYRYSFNSLLQGVLFYDIGDAFSSGFIHRDTLLTGRGFGIRLTTPLGPIRLDYGIPNGAELGQGVTHFSIGHAF